MSGSETERSRKSPREIVSSIFEALPTEDYKPKTTIATEIGSKEDTVDEYLALIQWIQEQPKIECRRFGVRRYAWRKEQEKRRQTK